MDIKKSKVTRAQRWEEKDYKNENGDFKAHFIEFENGDKGVYNSKSEDQDKFILGQEVDYEFHASTTKHPNKVKPYNPKYAKSSTSDSALSTTPATNEFVNDTTTPAPASQPAQQGQKINKEQLKQHQIIAQSCMGKAVQLITSGRIEGYNKLEDVHKLTDRLMEMIDELALKHYNNCKDC